MASFISLFQQSYFLPPPPLTEKKIPNQQSKVFIVTGGYSGIGLSLASILYSANSTIYIAGRSPTKASSAITTLKSNHPDSKGHLHFLPLDLSDLSTIKSSVSTFLSKEKRLDVLWNNAGIMHEPPNKTAQGHETVYSTNILGPFLLTKLLTPILKETADKVGETRVCWAGSAHTEFGSPMGGVTFVPGEDQESLLVSNKYTNYNISKAASYFLGMEYAKRHTKDNILSVSFNPGNLQTPLQRHHSHLPFWLLYLMSKLFLYDPMLGAYTELYAGLSPELSLRKENDDDGSGDAGAFIWPWGRKGRILREDIRKEVENGGKAGRLWGWCERSIEPYI